MMTFSYDLRVRYSEIDGQKIVFNGNYLTYIDIGMTEYYRNILGDEWITHPHKYHFDPVVVKTTLEFKKPAQLDQVLSVFTKTRKIGNSSLTFDIEILHEQTVILTADMVQVNCDLKSGASVSIPDIIKQKINDFEARTIEGEHC